MPVLGSEMTRTAAGLWETLVFLDLEGGNHTITCVLISHSVGTN